MFWRRRKDSDFADEIQSMSLCYRARLFFLAVILMPLTAVAQSSTGPNSVDKPVEEAFRNIQVLRGLPQSELLPVMHFMRASLGVHCDHCHIAENDMYFKDDKPAKQTARRMIRMVEDINKNFGGEPVVTCNTCHRGSLVPIATPGVNQAAFEDTLRTPAEPPPSLPTVETIFQNYTTAIGGEQKLSAIRSRLIKQTVSRPRLVDPQQIPVAIEVYEKSPDKILAITHFGEQTVRGGFDGSAAWIEIAGKSRSMTAPEQARLRSFLSIYPLGQLKDHYSKLKVIGKEELDERTSAWVVEGIAQDNKQHKLYFDVKTGLLVRRIAYTRTRVGDDPEQVDFADYRDIGGIKIPLRVTTSYLDNNHLNSVRTTLTVNNNVTVDDGQFVMPAAKQ